MCCSLDLKSGLSTIFIAQWHPMYRIVLGHNITAILETNIWNDNTLEIHQGFHVLSRDNGSRHRTFILIRYTCQNGCQTEYRWIRYIEHGFSWTTLNSYTWQGALDWSSWNQEEGANYSKSQEICTRFCCALLCCGYAIVHNEFTWSIYPYSSGLLCWHWGNR